jgi:2-dehydro-3-deoxyphosphogluconate aldolase / (4S)-4-hydroxy-2-oxoglutarate aldolase
MLFSVPFDPLLQRSAPFADAIRTRRLIAVLRRIAPRDRLLGVVDELVDDGIRIFEITLDAPEAAADLAAVRAHLQLDDATSDLWLGAGTVRTAEQVAQAKDADAAFAVSPILDPEVMRAASAAGLPFLPGAYTPTEVDAAWRAGATFVKLFPGSSLGPDHVRELRGPLPEVETVVTGGVDGSNAASFLAAGASAVGVGSALLRMSSAERRTLVAEASTPQ